MCHCVNHFNAEKTRPKVTKLGPCWPFWHSRGPWCPRCKEDWNIIEHIEAVPKCSTVCSVAFVATLHRLGQLPVLPLRASPQPHGYWLRHTKGGSSGTHVAQSFGLQGRLRNVLWCNVPLGCPKMLLFTSFTGPKSTKSIQELRSLCPVSFFALPIMHQNGFTILFAKARYTGPNGKPYQGVWQNDHTVPWRQFGHGNHWRRGKIAIFQRFVNLRDAWCLHPTVEPSTLDSCWGVWDPSQVKYCLRCR